MSALNVRMVPISLLGEVLLGKMVQPSRKNETDELRPYLRAAHLPAPGTLSLDVSEQQMYFSPHEIDRLDLRKSDVVIVEGGAGYGRSAYLDNDLDGWGFQNSIVRVRAYPGVSVGKYVYYALQHAQMDRQIELEVSTATLPHFTAEKVGRFRIPLPPLTTQRAIADYLDREIAEIDDMTADLDKMEALLTERRATTVRSTMDQAAEFGRIPLGYVAQTVSGATPSTSIAKYWADSAESGIHWVSIGDMSSVPVVLETQKYVSTEGRKAARLKVAGPGTVLFAMYGATLGAVSRLGVDACWNQAILGVFPHESRLRSEFLESALIALKPSLEALHRGNTQNNLNAEQVKGLPIPLPPLEVQEAISQELSEKTAEIDAMLADIMELRDLLAERRAAVIAAAVTGQIDIPTAEEPTHA